MCVCRDFKVPAAPEGHRWKKVQHDDTVTWLASWVENVQGNIKYVMPNPSSILQVPHTHQHPSLCHTFEPNLELVCVCVCVCAGREGLAEV